MKPVNGFKSEQMQNKYPMLPPGPYVASIQNVKIEGTEPDQQLIIRLEIIEGDWAGYYTKRYTHDTQNAGFNQQYQAKYKGDLKIQIPNNANTARKFPETDLKRFNHTIWAIETSNPGYHWDWNEMGLKGKITGLNVQEGTFNGNPYTTPAKLENVDDVRKGLVQTMKPRKPSGEAQVGPTDDMGFTPVETDSLPF